MWLDTRRRDYTGVVVGSLRDHPERWFIQALTVVQARWREGVVVKAKTRGLEEVVVQLDG